MRDKWSDATERHNPGCYTLDLYCAFRCAGGMEALTGQTLGECRRQARRRGWKFKGEMAACPRCVKERGL